jgi:Fe2+ or Zn2+ uptake regulation protein
LALDTDLVTAKSVLEKLVRGRLLRTLEREDGKIVYELAHEYLIQEITLSPEVKERKQV